MKKLICSFLIIFIVLISVAFASPGQEEILSSLENSNSDILGERYNGHEIKKHKQFRKDNGFEYSSEALAQALKRGNKDTIYGLPLTEEELAELESRDEFADSYAPALIKELRGGKEFSDIGVFYRDNKNKGKLVVALTEKAASHVPSILTSKIPDNKQDMLIIKSVKYSESDLVRIASEISINEEKINKLGSKLNFVETDDKNNRVNVAINPYNLEVVEYLKNEFGDVINVIEEKPMIDDSRTFRTVGIYGGLQIGQTSSRSTGRGGCTVAYSLTGTNSVVTAGHCLAGSNFRWFQGGDFVGTRGFYRDTGPADVGIINLGSSRSTSSYIYRLSMHDRLMTSWQRYTEDFVGQRVQMSGAYSGLQYGEIISRYNEHNGRTHLRRASYSRQSGDSGAPVFWGGNYRGIHSAGNSTSGLYSHIHHATNVINSNFPNARFPQVN